MARARPDPVEARIGELHATPPSGFVALRNALARELTEARDPRSGAVATLPRPTLPVWAINAVARTQPDALDALLTAASRVVKAYRLVLGGGDRDALLEANDALARALEQATAAAARSAAAAGHPLSTNMLGRVRSTLRALVLGDREGRERLQAGHVLGESAATGLDTLESLRPLRTRPAARAAASPRDRERARRALAQARREIASAERELATASAAAARLRREAEDAQRRADERAARAQGAQREAHEAARKLEEARARLAGREGEAGGQEAR